MASANADHGLQQAQADIGLAGWFLFAPARYGKVAKTFGLATTSDLGASGFASAVVTATVVVWQVLAAGATAGSTAFRLIVPSVVAAATVMIRVRCFVFIFVSIQSWRS
jgi:hypothetical protein